jgi:hypothetical protein
MNETDRGGEQEAARAIDPDQLAEEEMLIGGLLFRAQQAADDPKEFFEFVMRHETTGAPVTCAPHQRLLFDFVRAHPRCVIRMPVGTAKTFSMASLTLWLIGDDASARGAFVSSTQSQAAKPVSMARDLIETSAELRLVYPGLRKSSRKTDPWTQTEITVARPPGIRDPTVVAIGIDGAIAGARLSWVVVDDILDRENTSTPAGLQKVHEWFDSTVLSRIDPKGGRIVVTNTPWHPDDLTYKLEKAGWPTLTMDVEGNVGLANCPDFDSPELVPSTRPGEVYRLAAHDEPKTRGRRSENCAGRTSRTGTTSSTCASAAATRLLGANWNGLTVARHRGGVSRSGRSTAALTCASPASTWQSGRVRSTIAPRSSRSGRGTMANG